MLASLSGDLAIGGQLADKLIQQIDSFVERLKYESDILKRIAYLSAAEVKGIASPDLDSDTESPSSLAWPSSFAWIGQIKESENGLSIKVSTGELIPLSTQENATSIEPEQVVIVLGDVEKPPGDAATLSVRYAKLLKKE